ncbi:hydrogen gas-evolving membrane-bound hydrogenase subunit E [Algisphaera agarilytica]|nr:hydrogen gas-evolving membrane-bound hydrogenase subunit E [Algisphaera agarilytica]
MLWTVLGIFALAGISPLMIKRLGDRAGWLLALGPLAVLAYWIFHWPDVTGGQMVQTLPWAESLGVELALVGDGLAGAMSMLISGIGALIVIYASGYLHGDPRLGKFYSYLFIFMGAMLGMVISDNLITLFVFWEMTSVSSYLLIGFNHKKLDNRDAALKALLVTGGGGLALLAGIIMLGFIGTSLGLSFGEALRVSTLIDHAEGIQGHSLFAPMLILVLLGCFTKSAQFPFHFWLPTAMAGPTPVSAYLHSATMVKAGVFLLGRMHPVLGNNTLWIAVVTTVGAMTMLVGAVLAVGQRDMKGILAYTTISVLGTLVMLLGVGTDRAIEAAVAFLFAHGLYKAALFMAAGNVDHATGTRDVTQLSGLRRLMPWTAAAALIAALSKAGAPPMFGYLGKKLLLEAKLNIEMLSLYLTAAAVIANICMVAVALLLVLKPFWGELRETPRKAHELPLSMNLGPMLLAGLGLFVGLIPKAFDETLGEAMASSIRGEPLEMKLKLLFGLSIESLIVVGLSFGALGLGYLLYRFLRPGPTFWAPLRQMGQLGPNRGYQVLMAGLLKFAAGHTRLVQSGFLRRYLMVVVSVFALAAGPLAYVAFGNGRDVSTFGVVKMHELLLVLLVISGAVYGVLSRSRLAAVAAIGGSGIGLAVLFAVYGSVDLAITQLMVETLMVVILVMVLLRLPQLTKTSKLAHRGRDLLIAAAGGTTVTLMVLATATVEMPASVSAYYLNNAAPEAFGRNVVNVILVDFRALDTLGEIVVVAVAGIGVASLIWLSHGRRTAAPPRRKRKPSAAPPQTQTGGDA